MRNAACLILGTCLALQTVPMNALKKAFAAPAEEEFTVPLHRLDHARELLDAASFDRISSEEAGARDYAHFIIERTRALLPPAWKPHAKRIATTLIEEANRYEMDPLFLMAVIQQESRFRPGALGSHGEIGLMQIKPSTVQWILDKRGVAAPSEARLRQILKDPATNIRYGAAYMAHLRESFRGRRHLYISAYNMGPTNVRMHLRDNNQPRIYSDKVLAHYMGFAMDFMIAYSEAAQRHVAATN